MEDQSKHKTQPTARSFSQTLTNAPFLAEPAKSRSVGRLTHLPLMVSSCSPGPGRPRTTHTHPVSLPRPCPAATSTPGACPCLTAGGTPRPPPGTGRSRPQAASRHHPPRIGGIPPAPRPARRQTERPGGPAPAGSPMAGAAPPRSRPGAAAAPLTPMAAHQDGGERENPARCLPGYAPRRSPPEGGPNRA